MLGLRPGELLRWRHLGYFGKVVLCSSLGTFALDRLLRFPVFMLLLEPKHVTLKTMPEAAIFVAFMLIWTLFDGCFAGYLAARIGRRAPLPSALLVAVTWMTLMIGSGWDSVPPWFLALNVTMMVAGTIVGGTLPGLRPRAQIVCGNPTDFCSQQRDDRGRSQWPD